MWKTYINKGQNKIVAPQNSLDLAQLFPVTQRLPQNGKY